MYIALSFEGAKVEKQPALKQEHGRILCGEAIKNNELFLMSYYLITHHKLA